MGLEYGADPMIDIANDLEEEGDRAVFDDSLQALVLLIGLMSYRNSMGLEQTNSQTKQTKSRGRNKKKLTRAYNT